MMTKTERRRVREAYRSRLMKIRGLPMYSISLAKAREMAWYGVPIEALTRDDMLVMLETVTTKLHDLYEKRR